MAILHGDLGHMLTRVEEVEGIVDKHAHELRELKEQIKVSKRNKRKHTE